MSLFSKTDIYSVPILVVDRDLIYEDLVYLSYLCPFKPLPTFVEKPLNYKL